MLEELQKIVGELYGLYGATTQVVKLSQILDELIVEAQNNDRVKQKGGGNMKVKVSLDREKLLNWFNEDCKIECEICPLKGYMCETLLEKAYNEYCEQVWNDNNK